MIHHEIFDRYKLGWDYSKKQTNGKNLYLFCESSHISEELQNSLKNEIFQCVNSHLFDTFFVEEPTEYKNSHSLHYASEKEAIDGMKNNMNWPRSRIQTFYRLSKLKNIDLLGCENLELTKLFFDSMKKINVILEKMGNGEKFVETYNDLIHQNKEFSQAHLEFERTGHYRSLFSLKYVVIKLIYFFK